ncbi:MAG: hypothetical protein KDH15_12730 [Rhodocyclaceae bacterium]|nr:hypothetical protein [Rhodocyclaceae bacterium]
MNTIKNLVLRLVREEEGAAASEYAILVALIAAAVAAAVALFDIRGIYTQVSGIVKGLLTPAAP